MFRKIIVFLLIGLIAWAYQASQAPPPKICGSASGPPLTGPRLKLRDGRYLAYKEHGVPKDIAKYKIVLIHGFSSNRHDALIAASKSVDELGVYFVTFDRPGYGESDPDPKRSIKSVALDIEDLADQLGLGSKFYVVGFSMGGNSVWGCLKYIPHRLAGAGLVAPVVNYWWPSFPSNISEAAFKLQPRQDQWAVWVTHHAPWLVYWWNTQNWFPGNTVIAGRPTLSSQDFEILSKMPGRRDLLKVYSTQQGVYESLHRDLMIGFGKWEFDPMDLEDPFVGGEGSVHLWQGDEDGMVPVMLQRYISKKLTWINYHELPNAGHLFAYGDAKEAILKTLLKGNEN